ncbi:MAG: hypothetical protein IJS99_04295 [Synergistaceae bacterium]|nr:hypothetical protein [Synergistaceae bacterium]
MKRYRFIVMLLILAVILISPALAFEEVDHTAGKDDSAATPANNPPVVTQKEKGLVDWTNNYVEATGMAVAPTGTKGAQAKALARRGAMLDLQRNLLEFLVGVQIDADTRMENFMAEDRVRSELHGIIRNVEATSGEWDGESYVMKGRIKLGQIRTLIAPSLPPAPAVYPEVGAGPDITIYEDVEPEPAPAPRAPRKPGTPRKSTGGKARYTGLVIDVRHLPYVPSMTFQVYDASGRAVYGMNFVNRSSFLSSGICSYFSNINAAKGEIFVANNPIVAKAIRLGKSNVDIFISNSAAAKIRSSSYDFRKDCKVIIVSR